MASDQTKTAKGADKASAKSGAKPVKASAGKPAKAEKPNLFERIAKYFRDVRVEMQRVVWPGREEIIQSSLVVVVALFFFIIYVVIWDSLSQYLFITLPSLLSGKVG